MAARTSCHSGSVRFAALVIVGCKVKIAVVVDHPDADTIQPAQTAQNVLDNCGVSEEIHKGPRKNSQRTVRNRFGTPSVRSRPSSAAYAPSKRQCDAPVSCVATKSTTLPLDRRTIGMAIAQSREAYEWTWENSRLCPKTTSPRTAGSHLRGCVSTVGVRRQRRVLPGERRKPLSRGRLVGLR